LSTLQRTLGLCSKAIESRGEIVRSAPWFVPLG
jgi:hypothetical protein